MAVKKIAAWRIVVVGIAACRTIAMRRTIFQGIAADRIAV